MAPLTYEIRYRYQPTDSSRDTLWYYGEQSVSPKSYLAAGRSSDDFRIYIFVEIQGRNGGYARRNLSVQACICR